MPARDFASAEVRVWLRPAPGPFQSPTMGATLYAGHLGLPCPLSLRKPFALLSDTTPAGCLQVDVGVPWLRFFLKRMGTRVQLILREPHGSWTTSSREELGTHAFGKGLLSTYCVLALRCAEDSLERLSWTTLRLHPWRRRGR